MGNNETREWLISSILNTIKTYNIDYIVQDGEDMIKTCDHTDHTHNLHDSNYANSVQGLDVVIATIRRVYPQLILENLEDGGTMCTYKVEFM